VSVYVFVLLYATVRALVTRDFYVLIIIQIYIYILFILVASVILLLVLLGQLPSEY
jgi:hypothetical protein